MIQPKRIKLHLMCIMILALNSGVFAQQQPDTYVPPSPNAASLGVYGEIPVSEYTGIPKIDLPLFDITDFGVDIPVSLDYFGGGIHGNDEASWVGLAWSLNCGGVITRTKRHLDDIGTNGFAKVASTGRPCSESYDQEPDIFYYNFGGYSGKFFFDAFASGSPTYAIRKFTRDNLNIQFNPIGPNFIVTTPDGVIYNFSEWENTTEVSKDNGSTTNTQSYVSAWFLTSVTAANGAVFSFQYDHSQTRQTYRVYKGSVSTTITWTPNFSWTCCSAVPQNPYNIDNYEMDLTTDEVIPLGITFPNGYISFVTSPRTDIQMATGSAAGRQLTKMIIYKGPNASYPEFKEWDFTYGLYNSQSGQPATVSTRLQLQSVAESSGSVSVPPFSFLYNTNTLPDKGTQMDDNPLGATGLLQKITYPTGGTNTFNFESNVYLTSGGSATGGGARIQRIAATDPTNTTNIKRYEYTNGRLMGYFSYGTTIDAPDFAAPSSCCGINNPAINFNYHVVIVQDNSALGEVADGALVGYDQVTIYNGDNGENGKTIKYFSNTAPVNPNYFQGKVPVSVPPNISNFNGTMTDEYDYANNNGTMILLKRTHSDFQSAGAYTLTPKRLFSGNCSSFSYTLTSEWIQQTDEIAYQYDNTGNNAVSTTTNFYYDNPNNVMPTRMQTTNSKNETLLTTSKFAQDYAAVYGGVYTTMVNRNIISPVVEQDMSRNGVQVTKQVQNYNDWFGNGAIITPQTKVSTVLTNAPDVREQYYSYDLFGNPLEIGRDNNRKSYLWGYGSVLPVGVAKNASLQAQNEILTNTLNATPMVNYMNPAPPVTIGAFTTNYAQTYSFSYQVFWSGTAANFGALYITVTDANGRTYYAASQYGAGTYSGSATIPIGGGTYTVAAQAIGFTQTAGNTLVVQFTSTYQTARVHQDVYYNSFEETVTGITTTDFKTGKQCLAAGPYNVIMPYSPGNYVVSWWQKPTTGGSWTYMEQTASVAGSGTADLSIGSSSVMIDEVRVYPVGAQLETYTYDPLVGMTSYCDVNNIVTYYQYDALGRLVQILDQNKNIVRKFCYNYAGQPAACNQ